ISSTVHQAAQQHDDVALALKNEFFALNAPDSVSMTPLHRAVQYGNITALRFLLHVGARINQRTDDNDTALSLAALYRHIECVVELVHHPLCDLGMTDSYGNTAAYRLMRNPDWDIIEPMLLQCPRLAKARNSMGRTLLSVWSYTPVVDAVAASRMFRLLLAAGSDIENPDMEGMTPLLWAIATDNVAAVRNLISAGARVDAVSVAKRNLLHYAVYYASVGILEYLHSIKIPGVDVELVDNEGKTAWDCLRYIMVRQDHYAYFLRRPSTEEVSAFVALYKDIRDRKLQGEIAILESALGAINNNNPDHARAKLWTVIAAKKQVGCPVEVETFKTIDLQIREAMWEAATESLGENIQILREKVETSVWKRESRFDGLPNL
ncbi:Ankyrin repeat-containing domain protein, partial [Rhypophila decipiens]